VVRVRHQQEIVSQLERDGHDSQMARELLSEFERSLEFHRHDRARIRAELMNEQTN